MFCKSRVIFSGFFCDTAINMYDLTRSMHTTDMQIVSQLRQNARMPVFYLSKAVKRCRATVTYRLKELQSKVIQQYTVLVDFSALGYLRLLFSVSLDNQEKDVFCRYMIHHAALNNLSQTTNGPDYFIEMIFADRNEAEEFLSSLQKGFRLTQLQYFFVEKDLVREDFLKGAQ